MSRASGETAVNIIRAHTVRRAQGSSDEEGGATIVGQGSANVLYGVAASTSLDHPEPSISAALSGQSEEQVEQTLETLSTLSTNPSVSTTANSTVSSVLHGRTQRNELTPIFSAGCEAIDVFADEALFQAVQRLHPSFDPDKDYNPLIAYGLERGRLAALLPAEKIDLLRDVIHRYEQPHILLFWDNLTSAIQEVASLNAKQVTLADRGVDDAGKLLYGLPVDNLQLIAHIVYAAQQILVVLTSFSNRDVCSRFTLDIGYGFLHMLEAHPVPFTVFTTLGMLQGRLLRADVHIRRNLWAIKKICTGAEEDRPDSVNSTL
uniref:Uncharacterized protein n=1 Tax=Mycena chlorophos TaxID=658473 RepID=A0ABQ0M151_MYCCL|nr:predicted protein [Mycena chlorophos]